MLIICLSLLHVNATFAPMSYTLAYQVDKDCKNCHTTQYMQADLLFSLLWYFYFFHFDCYIDVVVVIFCQVNHLRFLKGYVFVAIVIVKGPYHFVVSLRQWFDRRLFHSYFRRPYIERP